MSTWNFYQLNLSWFHIEKYLISTKLRWKMKIGGGLISKLWWNRVITTEHRGYFHFYCWGRSTEMRFICHWQVGCHLLSSILWRIHIGFRFVTFWGRTNLQGLLEFRSWWAFRRSHCCRTKIIFYFWGILSKEYR